MIVVEFVPGDTLEINVLQKFSPHVLLKSLINKGIKAFCLILKTLLALNKV